MVWFAQLLDFNIASQAAVGIATVIGHDWPVFLRFQGGRGVFTSLGVIAILNPWLGLIALVSPSLFFAPFKMVALGVSTAMVILPVASALAYEPFGIEEPLTITMAMVVLMLVMAARRLTAPRSPISRDVPLSELITYRLLFDRDIKDRKAWINHKKD